MFRNAHNPRILALALGLTGGLASQAADVFIGGPNGLIHRGDTMTGGFEVFNSSQTVKSLAVVGSDLLVAVEPGWIHRYDLATRASENDYAAPNDAAALAADGGTLLVGGLDRTVVRIDPLDGTVLATYAVPDPVAALTVYGGYIYASGPNAAVYRASTSDGVFSYFTCFCFGSVAGLAASEEHLFLIDNFSMLWRIDRADGMIDNLFFLSEPGTDLVFDGDHIAVSLASRIDTLDADDGSLLNSVATPAPVGAMALRKNLACPADLWIDGTIDLGDLSVLLVSFGLDDGGDVNGDQVTDLNDLALLLVDFGTSCE